MWKSKATEGENYEESVKSMIRDELETMALLERHMSDYDVSISEAEQQVIAKTASALRKSSPHQP